MDHGAYILAGGTWKTNNCHTIHHFEGEKYGENVKKGKAGEDWSTREAAAYSMVHQAQMVSYWEDGDWTRTWTRGKNGP